MNAIVSAVTRQFGKVALTVAKHKPEIALVVGAGLVVASAVTACKETYKAEDILAQAAEVKEKIDQVTEQCDETEYSKKDRAQDLTQLYLRTGIKFFKAYWPSLLMMVAGLGLIFYSHGLLRGDLAASVAAYNGLDNAFHKYRERVANAVGAEAENDIYTSAKQIVVEAKDADGKEIEPTIEKVYSEYDPANISPFARFFDETSSYYKKDTYFNKNFVIGTFKAFVDKLKVKGYVRYLDVLEDFGFLDYISHEERVKLEKLYKNCGWIYNSSLPNGGMSFGLDDACRNTTRDFINEKSRVVLLNFNCDPNAFV